MARMHRLRCRKKIKWQLKSLCTAIQPVLTTESWPVEQRWSSCSKSKGKVKECLWLLMGLPSYSYRMTLAIWNHSVTCHPTQVNVPHLNPSQWAGTWFTYHGGMKGWVDLGYLAMHRPGVEPAIFQSLDDALTTALPSSWYITTRNQAGTCLASVDNWTLVSQSMDWCEFFQVLVIALCTCGRCRVDNVFSASDVVTSRQT